MKLRLSRIAVALVLAAGIMQACSNSTSVEPPKEGNLVFGGTSIIDVGMVGLGSAKDTSLRITNTGSGDLVITSSGASSTELSSSIVASDTIKSGGYQDFVFHVTPSDTGVRMMSDTIHYTTAGKNLSLVLTFMATGHRDLPGAGSSYTFAVVSIDTNGVSTEGKDRTLHILANDLEYGGKTNVVEVIDDSGNTSFYHRESNGDLSTYIDLSAAAALGVNIPNGWFTIPLGSKQEIKQTLFDTTGVTIPGVPIPVDVTVQSDATYTGPQNVAGAAGQTFATESGALKVTFTISGLGGLIKVSQIETANIWYSQVLQFYAKRSQVSQAIGSKRTATETWTIKSYSLK
jgi:hypothetical protein